MNKNQPALSKLEMGSILVANGLAASGRVASGDAHRIEWIADKSVAIADAVLSKCSAHAKPKPDQKEAYRLRENLQLLIEDAAQKIAHQCSAGLMDSGLLIEITRPAAQEFADKIARITTLINEATGDGK